MANTWTYKTVYIRETTDGKTKWVKLDGVVAKRSRKGIVQLKLTDFDDDTGGWYHTPSGSDEKRFISRKS